MLTADEKDMLMKMDLERTLTDQEKMDTMDKAVSMAMCDKLNPFELLYLGKLINRLILMNYTDIKLVKLVIKAAKEDPDAIQQYISLYKYANFPMVIEYAGKLVADEIEIINDISEMFQLKCLHHIKEMED